MGDFPSGQRGQTVNLLSIDFGGPNPPSPTKKESTVFTVLSFFAARSMVRSSNRERHRADLLRRIMLLHLQAQTVCRPTVLGRKAIRFPRAVYRIHRLHQKERTVFYSTSFFMSINCCSEACQPFWQSLFPRPPPSFPTWMPHWSYRP